MNVSIKICDRCKKQFKSSETEWSGILRRRERKLKFIELFYGCQTGYEYIEHDYDLCGECTEQLKKFMDGAALEVQDGENDS